MSPVVGLAAMGGAAVAVEAVGVGISVEVQRFDFADARARSAGGRHRLRGRSAACRPVRREKARVVGIGSRNRARNASSTSYDAGAMHGPTAARICVAPGAELLHRRDCRVGHAGERAAPAGMRRADHPGIGIGEQHRRAIGGEDPEQQAGRSVTIASACGRSSCGQAPLGMDRARPNAPGGPLQARRPAGPQRSRADGSRRSRRGRRCCRSRRSARRARRSKRRRGARGSRAGGRRGTAARMTSTALTATCLMMMSSSAWLPTMKS